MSVPIGDYDGTAAVINYFFTTRASTGTPTATFTDEAGTGSPVLRVIRAGQESPVTAVPVVDTNVGTPQIDGKHLVTVDLSADGEYNPGSGVRTFGIYVSNGKVDSVVVTGETLATFTTGRYAELTELVSDVWAKAGADPAAVPGPTATLEAKVNWICGHFLNPITQTSATQTLRNNADDGDIGSATVSDDGTTGTRGGFS